MATRIPDAAGFRVIEKIPTGGTVSDGTPDVTVVTVVFNAVRSGREKEFLRCLDSVQTQTGCRVEHLIVDGASKDGTAEIVAGYANASVPIRCLSLADRGIYEAMNRGIALARGKYVVYLNSDDRFCSPRGMAASVAALESSGADFSYAPAHVVDAEGKRVKHDFEKADESRNLFCGMTICHQTILIRRDVMVAADGFDLAYRSAADYDLFLRLIYAGRRGVRVGENFVEFLAGGFSSVNAKLSEDEVDAIFRTRLRENFGVDFSAPVMRRMRMTQEWPIDLTGKILALGERSFGRPLAAANMESPAWDRGVEWLFAQALPQAIWEHCDFPALPEGMVRQILHCLRFSLRHPADAFGAVKARLVHRRDAKRLHEWFLVRCILIAGKKLESYRVTYPHVLAGADDALRKSVRGFVCTDAARLPVGSLKGDFRELLVLLYSCAYQEGEKTAEVSLNGSVLGRVTLQPTMRARWSALRLPRAAADSADSTVEIRLTGGGEFVFGGLCFCPGL